jgi:integrase
MPTKHESGRKAHRLNDLDIRKLKHVQRAAAAGHDILLSDGARLYLRVRPSGRRTWIIRRKRAGRVEVVTIGDYPEVGLKLARQRASDMSVRPGPAAAIGITVARAVAQYMAERIHPHYRRPATVQVYATRLTREFGNRALASLQAVELAALVRRVARTRPVAANRTLGFLKAFLGWCVETGYLADNPAASLTRRVAGGKERPRERVLTHEEIRRFWHADDLRHRRLLRFLLLSALRIGEAQKSVVAQIRDGRLHLPAALTKNARPHWVHLPPLAFAQIEGGTPSEPLFRAASATAVAAAVGRWCARHGVEPWRPHDLRRTAATGLGDAGVPPHVVARMLNHVLPGSESLPVYLRSEWEAERVEAAERWAARVAAIVGNPGRDDLP